MNNWLVKAQYGPRLIDLLWNSDRRSYVIVNEYSDDLPSGHTEFTAKDFTDGVVKKQSQLSAKIIAIDPENMTGMIHNTQLLKRPEMVGCLVTVRPSHNYGETKVYYCYELREYFSDREIELIIADKEPEERLYIEE